MVDASIIVTLKELPPKHRRYLFKKYGAQISGALSKDQKLAKLASLIGPNQINKYINLYLKGNGGLITWYSFNNISLTLPEIALRFNEKFPGIERGIFPELEVDGTPQVHRLRRIGKSLMVELAAMDQYKHYTQNWQPFDEPVDHIYRIVVRDDPLTLEIRAAYGKIESVYEVVAEAVGLRLNDGIRCTLDETRTKRLKRRLDANRKQTTYMHEDSEISRSSFESQPQQDLETAQAHAVRIADPNVREFTRVYICSVEHEDGFSEEVRFQIKLETGELRVRNGTSEFAIDLLRRNVIALIC
ncbi:MAG TPA: hypothetical protein VGZ00_01915 [Candidatus Baltobacteraceae bacterium]|jgi:hypothetical protein|nr:hypothetical protein [Candidatus Baltobacteraceae bacterium]